jgi:hypothetical protein
LIEQILEFNFAAFETRGVDIGQVVGNDIQVHLLGLHPGSGGVECAKHKG